MSDDLLVCSGVVRDSCRGSFVVDVVLADHTRTVRATLGGRVKSNRIRVVPGDDVEVSISPYDLSRGLITYRGQRKPAVERTST